MTTGTTAISPGLPIRRVVSAVIIGGRVGYQALLLARRRADDFFAGLWECPGGKVEDGETDEQALRREILEELGVDCTVAEHLCEAIVTTATKSFGVNFYRVFLAGPPLPLAAAELRWFVEEELAAIPQMPAQNLCQAQLIEALRRRDETVRSSVAVADRVIP